MRLFTLFIVLLTFLCISCKEGGEGSTPTDSISESNFYKNKKQLQEVLEGLYNKMSKNDYYGYNFEFIGDVTSDITQSLGSIYRNLDLYTYSKDRNGPLDNFWTAAYNVISQSNNLIDKIPDLAGIEQNTKDQALGEIYFLRGLAYFDLTRSFGGVPGVVGTSGVYIIKDNGSHGSRASLEKSYTQVESDLKKAISLFPSSFSTPTKASKASAEALLARLYLYMQDFNKAEQYATEVIDSPYFSLVNNYKSIFSQGNTKGTIFELKLNSGQVGPNSQYIPNSLGRYDSLAFHNQFIKMVRSRPKDQRNQLVKEYQIGKGNFYYPIKYKNANNIQVLRIAEMYLIRAEALVRKEDTNISRALQGLNKIRNRAGLRDSSGTGVNTTNKVLNAIEKERSIEFMGEGHRWFDLVRTGQALKELADIKRADGTTAHLKDKFKLVFPLPLQAGAQNPGY